MCSGGGASCPPPEGLLCFPAGVRPKGHSQTHSGVGKGAQHCCQSRRRLERESEGRRGEAQLVTDGEKVTA